MKKNQKKMLNNILNYRRINMKKIVAVLVLTILTVSCELFDGERWERIEREKRNHYVSDIMEFY